MITSSLLLAAAAACTLMFGFEAFRQTSSKAIRAITIIGTAALAMAAYNATRTEGVEHSAITAFFVAMLFGGEALGLFVRSRKNQDLRAPSRLLFAVFCLSLTAAAVTQWWR